MSLAVMQCTNLVLTKTGRANLLAHGFRNWLLSLAVLLLICPFMILLVFIETTRRYFIRLFPDSWLELATMY